MVRKARPHRGVDRGAARGARRVAGGPSRPISLVGEEVEDEVLQAVCRWTIHTGRVQVAVEAAVDSPASRPRRRRLLPV